MTHDKQQDPAWYTDNHSTLVAERTVNQKTIKIYCVGEMRIVNQDTGAVIRYSTDLEGAGFHTDEDLDRIGEDGHPWEWVNNSWFELFYEDQSTDLIAHSLGDALDLASEELSRMWLVGEDNP